MELKHLMVLLAIKVDECRRQQIASALWLLKEGYITQDEWNERVTLTVQGEEAVEKACSR